MKPALKLFSSTTFNRYAFFYKKLDLQALLKLMKRCVTFVKSCSFLKEILNTVKEEPPPPLVVENSVRCFKGAQA
jgi:hypothetical protein